MPSDSAASAMPSIACASSQPISGFSGLPKLRQSVSASGSPPAHATFIAASSTALKPASRGSRQPSGGPSSDTAIPRIPSMRSTAASSPGRRTVRDPTSWSYCSNTQSFGSCVDRRDGRARDRVSALLELVPRALVGEQLRRDRADDLVVEERAQLAVVGHLADHGARQLPALAGGADVVEARRLDDGDHPLLRLGDHDLPRLEAGLAQRDAVEVHVDAHAVARHLGERRREPGRAAVLQRDDEAALDEVERHLDQRLAAERVADLDRRPLLVRAFEILRGEHRRAADPVAAGERAVEDEEVADALRARGENALGGEEADAHRVHERVRRVRLVESALAADVRDADAVAVVADARDGALEMPVGRAEAQPVEERDRPRAHRDDVAEDPADAGRGALERLDGRRVVVRLDLEGDGDAVAEVDHARVLARPLQHPLAARREPPKQRRRVLVAAVLGPEQREHRELEVVRVPAEQVADTVELAVGEPEGAMEWFRDRAQGGSVSAASDGLSESHARCLRIVRTRR